MQYLCVQNLDQGVILIVQFYLGHNRGRHQILNRLCHGCCLIGQSAAVDRSTDSCCPSLHNEKQIYRKTLSNFTMCFHCVLSLCAFTMLFHYVLSLCAFTVCFHYVLSLCAFTVCLQSISLIFIHSIFMYF